MDIKNRQQNIQKILLRAFRERWPEYQFGIKIKQALPLALPADAYNLTEVLLDLSLIGIGANKLFLSYLKHSLHSHLISYSAVIKRITKYSQYERYFCLIALLEFLINISDTCCCRTKPEESSLMNAILSLVHWLIELSEKIFLKIMEQNNIPTHEQKVCLERITTLNNRIVNNQFLMGIIYLAKLEDRELYEKCVMSYKRIHSLSKEDFIKDFYQMIFNKLDHMPMKELEPRCVESISVCLQPFIAIEVLINASADVSVNVSKLLMIQKLKKYSNARLYHEIIRSCFITLCHVKDVNYRIWGAFTLCKVPLILKQLHLQAKNVDEKLDYSEDVVKAFEMLLECTPILDLLDTTFACNSIECILVELRKQNLVNDDIMKKLVDRRISSMGKLEKFQISSTSPPIDKYVATIEPTLTALIQSLCEPIKPEFLNVLNTLVIDNRAFLLYSVAAVKGIHRKMISGLIKCNESCKEISGEAAKSKQNIIFRSNAFDVTFIMLFSIMQKCGGIDKFPEKSNDYFFEKWIRDGYIDLQSKPRSPLSVVKMSDSRLEELIAYFNDINQQPSPPISNKLSEICWSIPSLLYNCIIAWEKDMVKPAAVKNIIDNMRSKNCCFAIVAASWLCAYMKILKDDELAKPKVMLQQLMNPLDESIMKQETFSERFHLTQEIIMKLSRSVLDTKKATNNSNDSLFSDQWKDITTKKWLSYEVAINLDEILKSCGSFWIMKNLVDEIMHTKFIKDMENTLDIAFAIMHLNIESCTETLLKDILISMLFNKNQMSKITNPQSKALAKLSIYGILATIESAESSSQKKRPREDDDLSQAAKMRKTGIDQAVSIESTQNDKDQSSQQLKDSLRHSLQELFKVFHQQVVTDDELSPKINFIFQFFSLLVQFEKSVKIKAILRLIPNGLVMNLLKLVHQDDLTYGFILRLYDLSVSSGRLSAISDLCLLQNSK
ncbi:hypothetical protein PVAND_009720 [Polypedilum vanderplanki]|uniref:Mediator of RNA polymerase II transcription subunit 24 n=1 Tax=Polypedilum vanderplanki TaxID=319348 RepID=A0A9J6CEI9_POLVA|nr:hypothetical protein PVAND_009720 [Polypedilum vanderplanki]